MKTRTRGCDPVKVMLTLCLMVGLMLPMGSRQGTAAAADFMVKISRLEQTLDLIDSMGASDAEKRPTSALRDLLQEVGWIDSERSIVFAWDTSGDRPFSALLIPYRRANPEFKQAYRAMSRNDYYILSVPPGKAATIPGSIEMEMADMSQEASAATVSMTLALQRVIAGNRQSITNLLDTAGRMSSPSQPDSPAPAAADIRQMLAGLVDAAGQIDLLSLSLDLDESQFKVVAETVPVKGGKLSAFLAGSGMTTRLEVYQPVGDITFRSRSFDTDAALDMLDAILGPFYGKLGVDFNELTALGRSFTGEAAGGMSYGSGARVLVESMAVLKDDVDSDAFMEKVYLPWVEAYSRSVTRLLEKETGRKTGSVTVRTPDSTVGGHRVVGMRFKLPMSPMPPGQGRQGGEYDVMTYDVRTAMVGNLLLMAPEDARMAEMMRTAGRLRKKTSHGPLMTMEVDMGPYLSSLARIIPGHGIDPQSIPDLGKVSFVATTGSDRVISSAAMETDDIRMMMAYLKRMQPAGGIAEPASSPAVKTPAPPPPAKKPEKKPVQPVVRDAGYWMEQGRLAATYGAYGSAVSYYQKALAMGAEESRVFFNMGIAYGELGDYERALDHLNQAIKIAPETGAYYYGRARVYLLSGDKAMALADFEHAAELGEPDALQYLKRAGW